MELYRHAPLRQPDAIRLMTLHPGEESSSIRISLHEVSLGTNPRFEALSYTWATEDGDDRRSSCIECEGGKLLVTKNCEAALRRLRDNDVERIFWIDAICVDQDNTNERNHQVQLMREVYSTAHQVIIWLGDASTDFDDETGQPVSDIYMEYLDLMGSQIAQFREEGKDGSASPLYQKIESEANKFALNKVSPQHCGAASKIYITDAGGLVSGLFKKRLFPGQLFWSVELKQLHMIVSKSFSRSFFMRKAEGV
jgi:hypothetical protein